MWGDTAGLPYASKPQHARASGRPVRDCTGSPQCVEGRELRISHLYADRVDRCLVALNSHNPPGRPPTVSSRASRTANTSRRPDRHHAHGVQGIGVVDTDSENAIGYTSRGAVQAYVQFQQGMPEGIHRLQQWPVEVFQSIAPPPPQSSKPVMTHVERVAENLCELTPVLWKGRLCHMESIRPGSGGVRGDYYLLVKDAETGEVLTKFAIGYSPLSICSRRRLLRFASGLKTTTGTTSRCSSGFVNWDPQSSSRRRQHIFNSSV